MKRSLTPSFNSKTDSNPSIQDSAKETKRERRERQEMVAISLDYDGCGMVLNMEQEMFVKRGKDYPVFQAHVKQEGEFFRQYLKELTADKATTLYVGSNRQDRRLNNEAMTKNSTNCCFKDFESLAEQMRWEFNRLLLSDIRYNSNGELHLDLGSGMHGMRYVSRNNLYNFHPVMGLNMKINTIYVQMQNIAIENHEDNITFYFADDDIDFEKEDLSILKVVQQFFSKNSDKIPPNVTLVLLHFDWHIRALQRQKNETPNTNLEYARLSFTAQAPIAAPRLVS